MEADDEPIKRYLYPPLIEYLRLTCFDQLGQPGEWMTFDNWSNSKKKANERQEVTSNIKATDKVEFSKEIYKSYQLRYGVKNSFFKFLNETLPPHSKNQLLSKLRYRIQGEPLSNSNIEEGTDLAKANYLFSIRNNFTHNTYSKAPLRGFQSGKDPNWSFRETIYRNHESHWISTHKEFETELKNSVLVGIAELIRREL